MIFARKHRRETMELQLTAMIDIFTMIVIFLVMGTVIGVADVSLPPNTKLPKSSSIEALDAAPQVVFNSSVSPEGKKTTLIEVKALGGEFGKIDPIDLEEFHQRAPGVNPKIETLKTALKKTVDAMTLEQKKGGVLLNVVADQSTSYRDLFDVVKVFRESGFQSLLFVAAGDKNLGKEPEASAAGGPTK